MDDLLEIRAEINFNRFDPEDQELLASAFANLYYFNCKMIKSGHFASDIFKEENMKLLQWLEILKNMRLERNGFNTD